MPPKRPRKRTYRRRFRKTRRRQYVTNIPRSPITNSSIVRMRYCSPLTLTQTLPSVPATYVFNANSVYDPDRTGGGHQPNGYDQWSIFYNHYHVLGSKITVNFQSVGATAQIGAHIVGIALRDNTTTPGSTSLTEVTEQGNTSYRHMTDNDSSRAAVTVKRTFSAKKFFNKSKIVDSSELKGLMGNIGTGSDPSEVAVFEVFASHMDNAITGDPVQAFVTLEYIVVLTEPKELAQS